MMELATVAQSTAARSAPAAIWAARSLEVATQLRAAIMEGDDTRVARLLSDLLRVRGLTKGQRVRLQSRALMNLMHSLRSAALNDELTGLLNRRGFMQSATRLLDLALRDHQDVHLVYFRVNGAEPSRAAAADPDASIAREVLLRRMGNFLRDLFPSYGVYEVLGRLSSGDFAALTPIGENAARNTILERASQPERGAEAAALPLQVAIVRFDPASAVAIDELLQEACYELVQATAHAAAPRQTVVPIASIGSAPRSDLTLA